MYVRVATLSDLINEKAPISMEKSIRCKAGGTNMFSKPTRIHHYVPRFLLRPWTVDGQLHGYYWDKFKQCVRVRRLGVSAFCHQLDLLSLETSLVPSDALENQFFGRIDDLGAKAVAKLIDDGPTGLSAEERCDFGRLILSLDARRPVGVATIKEDGAQCFESELGNDPEIREAFERECIDEKPAEYVFSVSRVSLADRALLLIQQLVDNPKVGKVFINAHWRVFQLGRGDGSFLLSDRPLIRTEGYDRPKTVWALPLSPRTLFVASNSPSVIKSFESRTPLQLRKRVNESSLNQVDRYVFMTDEANLPLVTKHLKKFVKQTC